MKDHEPVQSLTLDELHKLDFPPDDFIIDEGILPKNGLLFVAGPAKSLKSFCLNSIIYHLITATPLFDSYRSPHGRPEPCFLVSKPQRILLFEQEIGYCDVAKRTRHMAASMTEAQRQQLVIHSRDHTMRLDFPEGVEQIAERIEHIKPEVVCFDPLIEFHTKDENSSQEMGMVLRNLTALQNTYNVAMIVTHHTGKPPEGMSTRSGPDLMRGSSVIFGKGDSFILLSPPNKHKQTRVDFTVRRGQPLPSLYTTFREPELRFFFEKWRSY